MLIIAHGEPRLEFVCRRLRISEEKLRLKLRRMQSLLRISHWGITTYHRSLHDFLRDKKRAGEYHIHPVRVALVRFQERSRPSEATLETVLESPYLYFMRMAMAPLFMKGYAGACIKMIPCLVYTSLAVFPCQSYIISLVGDFWSPLEVQICSTACQHLS